MFTARERTTGATVIVKPIAIRRPNGAYGTLLIADGTTGRGVWFDADDCERYVNLQGVDGNLMQEAEVVEDVYGENEEEREERANEPLAAYGSKPGGFDEAAGDGTSWSKPDFRTAVPAMRRIGGGTQLVEDDRGLFQENPGER